MLEMASVSMGVATAELGMKILWIVGLQTLVLVMNLENCAQETEYA